MFKRLAVYYKEMFPLLPRFFVAAIMFFEIYLVRAPPFACARHS